MRAQLLRGRAALCVALLIASAALAIGQGEPNAVPAPAAAAGEVASTQPSVGYRLIPKDTVHIMVFQEDDLDTTARIDNDGVIFFPLLGKAKIGGQTVQEATATMETLLKHYIINPQVSLEIVSYAKQHFTILGEVNKPGVFDMPDEGTLNVIEAIGMAGGYTKIADPHHVLIKRIVGGQEQKIPIDAKRLLEGRGKNSNDPFPDVLPGDTISVAQSLF